MDTAIIILLTIGMGIVSVEMFSKAWLGFLGIVAALLMYFAGGITQGNLLARFKEHGTIVVLCSSVLIMAFSVYSNYLGLGESQQEALAFFITVVVRLVMLVPTLPSEIDRLFHA